MNCLAESRLRNTGTGSWGRGRLRHQFSIERLGVKFIPLLLVVFDSTTREAIVTLNVINILWWLSVFLPKLQRNIDNDVML